MRQPTSAPGSVASVLLVGGLAFSQLAAVPPARACSPGRVIQVAAADTPAVAPSATAPAAEKAETSANAKKILAKVQARYAKMQAFHARFHQEMSSSTLGQSMPGDGECWFAKPGKMRWSYDKPEKQLLISDGAHIWFYQSEREQVQTSAIDPEIAKQIPTGFLNGTSSLTEGYVAELPKLDLPPKEGIAVDLTPQHAAPFQKLRVIVEPSTNLVTDITIFDPFGNVNRLSFTEIQPVEMPKPDFFEFKPPEGVRVIEAPTAPGVPAP